MKKEYDFSKGERGKFHCAEAELQIPVYLDDEVRDFVKNIASKKTTEINQVVNDILRSDMALAKAMH